MKKFMVSFYFVICVIFLHGIWNEQRMSSILPTNEILLRTEISDIENSSHEIVFSQEQAVENSILNMVNDYSNTWQGELPFSTIGNYLIGYRTETAEQNYIMPVYWETNKYSFPALTLSAEDYSDDCTFDNPNLEIISDYVSFNEEKLIFGIQNSNGIYQTNESFTFFAYLAALINPQGEEDDIVYALMHTVDQPGIIEPGLYKIFGSGMDDLTKLADIEVMVDEGVLLLICDWQPLLDDEDFMSWYNPENPEIAVMSLTQKITLSGGVQTADEGKNYLLYPIKNEITLSENSTPQVSNLTEIELENAFYLQVDYMDSEENFPVVAQIEFDNGQIRSFYPQSIDYSSTVLYQTEDISDIVYLDDWSEAVIRFSDDNVNFAELTYPQTSANQAILPEHPFFVYPNPVRMNRQGQTTIAFQRKSESPASISIYNLKGQLVRSYSSSPCKTNSLVWDLEDKAGKKVGSGLYFIRFQQKEKQAIQKVIILP